MLTEALKLSAAGFRDSGGKCGLLPVVCNIQTSTGIQGQDSRRGEIQIAAAMEEEFGRTLGEMQIQRRRPVSEQVCWDGMILSTAHSGRKCKLVSSATREK